MNPTNPTPDGHNEGGKAISLSLAAPAAVDPVCGMTVDPATARATVAHDGRNYYFCCPSCAAKFQADPARYLAGAGRRPAAAAPPGAVYTCPMHPEVRQDHPGACPKCGMALEPAGGAAPTTKVEYTCPMHPRNRERPPGQPAPYAAWPWSRAPSRSRKARIPSWWT